MIIYIDVLYMIIYVYIYIIYLYIYIYFTPFWEMHIFAPLEAQCEVDALRAHIGL